MPDQQLELTLPFEVITTPIAGRDTIRSKYKLGKRTSYQIQFKEILLRPGSNHRRIFEGLPELAESIFTHGQIEPFELFVLKDGRSFLKEGERRYRAYMLLIEQERFSAEDFVEFFPAKTDITEFTAMVQQYATNNFKDPFKPIENAGIAFDLKYNFGQEKSNEEVAEIMKVSRQKVDNLIELATLPDDLKNQIYQNHLSATHALTLHRSKKKLEKQAAKKEEEAGQTNMYVQPGYVDPLKQEMEDLEALDIQSEQYQQAEKERERREQERLEKDAVLVPVSVESMADHLGKRLAADAVKYWEDNAVDPVENNGKESVKREEIVLKQGAEINEESIEKLMHEKVENVYVFKEVQAAPSVVTEPVAEPEKSKYDTDRIEIAQIQNIIKLSDRISVRIEKLEISEGDKKDLSDWAKWLQKDAFELRDWVHANKKNLKRDR